MENKQYQYKALDIRVLAVATWGFGEWTAFIGAVAGKKHAHEFMEVATNGSKLYHKFAKVLFPELDEKFRYNY